MKLKKRLTIIQIIWVVLVLLVFLVERNAQQSCIEKCQAQHQTISCKIQSKLTGSGTIIEKVKQGTHQIVRFGKVIKQLFDKQNDTP